MAPSQSSKATHHGVDRIRAQFLTALHFGKLHPGDRVPSVRRLADETGLNRKTVHRAYRSLAREGLLELRPGSGTFLTEERARKGDRIPSAGDLVIAVNRCRAEASSLGLSPETFARVIEVYLGGGLTELNLAVSECNLEQIGLIQRDLRTALGLSTRPVPLRHLAGGSRTVVAGTDGIVTTECHRKEVCEIVAGLGLPVYCVALDPAFPQLLVRSASTGPLVMVVRDCSYEPVFLRLLRQMSVPAETVSRFRMVEPRRAFPVLAALDQAGEKPSVYISPLVEREMAGRVPAHLTKIEVRRHLATSSMDRLRAQLSLDLALGTVRP